MLTISISIASGVDAIFSFLPLSTQIAKLEVEIALVVMLLVLNLRGMRESIKGLATDLSRLLHHACNSHLF